MRCYVPLVPSHFHLREHYVTTRTTPKQLLDFQVYRLSHAMYMHYIYMYMYMCIFLITADVDEQLMSVAQIKTCPEREKYVALLMDEMHIKSDLVYDKHTGTCVKHFLDIKHFMYYFITT